MLKSHVTIEIMKQDNLENHRIYKMSVAKVYPAYVAKEEKKDRTKQEVDEIIRWLTGYSQKELEEVLKNETDFETFFAKAPHMNPSRKLITGVICGVRVEDIKHPTMQSIRYRLNRMPPSDDNSSFYFGR